MRTDVSAAAPRAGGEPLSVPRMAYVWRIPGCGCAVAAQVDEPKYARDVASFKADKSKRGFVIAHMTVEEARELPWGWPCEHMRRADEGGAS